MEVKPIPKLEEKHPAIRLLEFYRRLGWDGNSKVYPELVRLTHEDWQKMLGEEMEQARRFFRDDYPDPGLAWAMEWINRGPSNEGKTPGMVELLPGWVERRLENVRKA